MVSDELILTIALYNFEVIRNKNVIKLEWNDLLEVNNEYKTIVRSIDGINFEPIETIGGNGNINTPINNNITLP